MPISTRDQVIRHIGAGRSMDWLTAATGWEADAIRRLAEDNRFRQIGDGTFRRLAPAPAPPATIPVTPPPVATADHSVAGLVKAARATGDAKTGRLADRLEKTAAAIVQAITRAAQAEQAEEARAELVRLEAELNAARERAGLKPLRTRADKAVTIGTIQSTVDRSYDARAVRQWANANGVDCPARGSRLPRRVVDAYRAATQQDGAA